MATTEAEMLTRILESLAGFVYVYDLQEQRNRYASPRWGEQFGYSREETQVSPGALLPRIIHPDDLLAVDAHHEGLRNATDDRVHTLQYRMRRKSGEYVWLSSVDRPMDRDAAGHVRTIVGHAHEITRQKAAEMAEAESRARFQAIVENLPDAVFIAGADARILQVNDAACAQVGYSREQLRTMRVTDIVAPAFRDRALGRMRAPYGTATVRQSAHLRSDGTEVPVETVVVSVELDGQPAYLGVARDVRDRLRLEAQLRDAQRMEAIGRLAGSVAHDFNNILSAILGGAELLRRSGQQPETVDKIAAEIAAAAERGAGLTRQLLTFGRRQPTHLQPVDAGAAVERTLAVLRRLVAPGITIDTDIKPDSFVTADPSMFDQVVMNLALNGRDAMPDGGTLRVSVGPSTERPEMVEIAVTDTGMGIAQEDLPQLFEPFFTTKDDGHGTGIGLATVYGIVTQHQAKISVHTQLGEGTRFGILWPRANPEAKAANGARRDDAPQPVAVPWTVLVVDDNDSVRGMLRSLLGAAGHRVYVTDGPAGAREALAQHGTEIDLLLSDVALGGSEDGHSLAAALQAKRPDLAVVLMSGHAQDTTLTGKLERTEFLQKPFTLAQLNAAIQRLRNRP